ncbi:MAG: oligosaccharide flippase family protein [Planctomycetes bacterium]|nr:oligosaccharide flippase family protein [Planctomycetota bacterium]
MPEPVNSPPRGLRFALFAHPSVQAVRFATKLALPWFLTASEYGEAILPSLLVLGLQHVAVFGLDEALVSARALDAPLWRAMRGFQDRLALSLAALLSLVGLGLHAAQGQDQLGLLLVALAPMLFVANRATLPTWLLVRERRFFDLFVVDLGAVLAFAGVALLGAAAGLGPWSLVLGWWANALAALALATRRSLDLVPRAERGAADWPAVRRTGGRLTSAAVLGYVGERLDGAAIGFVLGRPALGLFENAQTVGHVLLGWGQNVADRYLFPTLAADERAQGSGGGYLRAVRTTILFVLPPHVVLALAADPLVRTVFPASWQGTAPLLAVLALAAAARCADLLAVTALKAAGQAADVVRLGWARLALVAVALASSLPHGLQAVALAVLASRVLSAAVALALAARRIEVAQHRAAAALGRAGVAFVAWTATLTGLAYALRPAAASWAPLAHVAVLGASSVLLWGLARGLLDRGALRVDLARFRARYERGARP